MNKKTKVGFISLGCSKNLVDTEVMLKKLADAGYEITPDETEADVVVINTCAFIESAKKEAIESILDTAWLKENRSLKGIVVTGCLAERYGEEIVTELPEVDGVVGVGSLDRIVEAVQAAEKKEKFFAHGDKNRAPMGGERILTTPAYTAYLKIAEGCDNCCTYCAIPLIRGRFRSRPMEDIVREAKELEARGVKELNIVAQDTSRYGLDLYGKYALTDLVRAICAATEIPWIRLIYCYPDKITDELVKEFAENPRLIPYVDLPIQHINDGVLRRMNRHGGRAAIVDAIERLRRAVPGITLRTTVIVGFPGESEEAFEELCAFIKETKFERLGAFVYSPEEGTPAALFDDPMDEKTKNDRYDAVMQTQNEVAAALAEQAVGKVYSVLVEGYDPTEKICYGRRMADAPDIDGKVYFPPCPAGGKTTTPPAPGTFVNVRITEGMDYDLIGEWIEEMQPAVDI